VEAEAEEGEEEEGEAVGGRVRLIDAQVVTLLCKRFSSESYTDHCSPSFTSLLPMTDEYRLRSSIAGSVLGHLDPGYAPSWCHCP
jgi:hypothetical protein